MYQVSEDLAKDDHDLLVSNLGQHPGPNSLDEVHTHGGPPDVPLYVHSLLPLLCMVKNIFMDQAGSVDHLTDYDHHLLPPGGVPLLLHVP